MDGDEKGGDSGRGENERRTLAALLMRERRCCAALINFAVEHGDELQRKGTSVLHFARRSIVAGWAFEQAAAVLCNEPVPGVDPVMRAVAEVEAERVALESFGRTYSFMRETDGGAND